jgi:hypothetical protein
MTTDQGWTTENTKGTYETSSWFEISVIRDNRDNHAKHLPPSPHSRRMHVQGSREVCSNICTATLALFPGDEFQLQSRPSLETEPQRIHCAEMINIPPSEQNCAKHVRPQCEKEGQYAWYLQGNEVARGVSVFSGEMVRRYTIIWGNGSNPRWQGNEGSGNGEGFVDSLQQGDWIVVWARAKVS